MFGSYERKEEKRKEEERKRIYVLSCFFCMPAEEIKTKKIMFVRWIERKGKENYIFLDYYTLFYSHVILNCMNNFSRILFYPCCTLVCKTKEQVQLKR